MNNVNNMYYQNYSNVNDMVDIQKEMMMQQDLTNKEEGFRRGNIFKNIYWPYNKDTYNFVAKNNREKLLLEIMQNAFYAHELNLYLDIYPNDAQAIGLYNQYSEISNKYLKEYEKRFGNIILNSNEGSPWPWINSPWPWERQ